MAETTLSKNQQSKETTLNVSSVSSARFLLSKTSTTLRAHMMSIMFPKRATPEISTVFSLPLSLLTKEQVQNALSTIKKSSSSKLSNTNHDVHASKEFILLLGQFINLSSVFNTKDLQKSGDKNYDALWAFSNMYADLLHDNVEEYYLQVTFPVPALSNNTQESGLLNQLQSLLSSIICLILPFMRSIPDDDEVTNDKVISELLGQELKAVPTLQANQASRIG